jgi:3-oxoacyl-[acyl-carrier protein] reductase
VDRLEGKVALVTGAGRGIGREVATKLASAGCRVVLNDLDEAPVEEVRRTIVGRGGQVATCPGDVTDRAFPNRFVETALDSFGGLDIIVNNAGFTWDAVIQKMTDEQWDTILDLHLGAPFRILRAAQPVLSRYAKAERAEGIETFRKVVNVSSMAATRGNAGQANYSSAKAAILGLTRTLAKEWGRYRVNVNAVAFGLIETRLSAPLSDGTVIDVGEQHVKVGISDELASAASTAIPLGRPGTPVEAAGAIYLLCTPESNYVTGQTIECSGGVAL